MRICVMAGVATLALVGSPVLAQDKPVAKDMALVGRRRATAPRWST